MSIIGDKKEYEQKRVAARNLLAEIRNLAEEAVKSSDAGEQIREVSIISEEIERALAEIVSIEDSLVDYEHAHQAQVHPRA